MENLTGFSKKNNDGRNLLVALSLLVVLFVGKSIIDSGHLIFYIVCLVLGIILYYTIVFVQRKRLTRPASLGKVYSKKYPIIVQYAPPKGINPAEAGLLYNCSVEPTDLTSLIYRWKFEKFIDIKTFTGENSKREYIKLIKKEDLPLSRPLFESEIFDSIFRMGDIKVIEGPFQLRYALMLEDLEYHGIQKGWMKMGGDTGRKSKNFSIKFGRNQYGLDEFGNQIGGETLFFGMFLLLSVFSIVFESLGTSNNISLSFSEFIWVLVGIFGLVLGGVIFYGTREGGGKLKFTEKGAELASQVIGYSKFIKSCDENIIKMLLKEDPLFIDRTLPYATAFGMETEFLKKISPLKSDWNARYVRGQKVPSRIKIFRIFVKDDNSLL